ncbi:hypothetical protein EXN66_Car009048 [Channa argus]|uniref:Uncharacterized protein n=1 Tax=Channa argus TaxID=215402 RepID=A0A6G1PSY0_CHAAH|nr:hypothetical protein EXN66_Car009048 [Channa argus]
MREVKMSEQWRTGDREMGRGEGRKEGRPSRGGGSARGDKREERLELPPAGRRTDKKECSSLGAPHYAMIGIEIRVNLSSGTSYGLLCNNTPTPVADKQVKLMPLFSVCWISVGCFKPPSVHSRICKDVQMNVRIRRCMWWRTPFGAEWFIVTVFSRTRVNATRNHSRMVNVHIFTTVAKWTLVFAEQSVFVAVLRTRDDESNGPCRDSVFIPAHYRIF